MKIPHEGHSAAWEYLENERILRIKQFRQVDGEIVAAYLHVEVADENEARRLADPIVTILNDRSKVSGLCEVRDGGIIYVHRPEVPRL
jgi:hypothetical protein